MNEGLQDISYDSRPAVLVIAREARAGEIAAMLESAGARAAHVVEPHAAALDDQGGGFYHMAYCAIDGAIEPELFDALLTRLDSAACIAGVASVVEISRADIDRAVAIAGHEDVTLLCEPATGERMAALALALRPRAQRLQDVSNDMGSARLARLSEEVGRIASALAAMAELEPRREMPAPALPDSSDGGAASALEKIFLDDDVVLGTRLREIIRARRARAMFFAPELFADPVWDMQSNPSEKSIYFKI
jgi:hypothetical protein